MGRSWKNHPWKDETPVHTMDLLGLTRDGRLVLWQADAQVRRLYRFPERAGRIVSDHYVIERRGVAIAVHCSPMAGGMVGLRYMGGETRAVPVSRKKLERKLLGCVYEDPEQVAETFRLLRQIKENLDARWTEPGRQRGWLHEKEARP